MGRAKRIILTLIPLGEAGKTTFLAQRTDTVSPPGNDLVRIALVSHIPDQAVIGRVENIVDGNGQFDHPKPGTQMPPGLGNHVDHFGAQLGGKLNQLIFIQFSKVRRILDLIEKGRGGFGTQNNTVRMVSTKKADQT